jgi:hypothetical protein
MGPTDLPINGKIGLSLGICGLRPIRGAFQQAIGKTQMQRALYDALRNGVRIAEGTGVVVATA